MSLTLKIGCIIFFSAQIIQFGSKNEEKDRFKWQSLSEGQIKSFTTGACSISKEGNYYLFERFPDTVFSALSINETWAVRTHCTSGIRISFITNSASFYIAGKVYPFSPQSNPFNIVINKELIKTLPQVFDDGCFDETFEFENSGFYHVDIFFPAYSKAVIRDIRISPGSILKPSIKRGTLLSIGNSITQAGGAYKGYTAILAEQLGLDLHNLGIGGHVFDTTLLPYAFIAEPDIITVAYGTNDWNGGRPPENIEAFFKRLVQLYEKTNIFVLEPIHRYRPVNSESGELSTNKNGQDLDYYRNLIRNTALSYPNIHVIDYRNILRDDPDLFTDGIHPTLEGHRIMGINLAEEIRTLFIPWFFLLNYTVQGFHYHTPFVINHYSK